MKGSIQQSSSEHYEITLNTKTNSLTCLQVTDLHIGNKGSWKKDFQAFRRIKKWVDLHDPDFIIITGDLFTGQKESHEYTVAFAVQFFDDLARPWIYVFGNHDPEGNTGRETIRRVMHDSEWGIVGFHKLTDGTIKHDFLIDLKSQTKQTPLWQIYAFDSGSEPGNASIKQNQLDWFHKTAQNSAQTHNKAIPAIAIFHIPLHEYHLLWQDTTLPKTGFGHERVCFEEDDGSAYAAFLKQGNIKACFCGHDHDNNYWGHYHGGILLVYGHVSGETGYHRHWPPGAKLISLEIGADHIEIQDLVDE